MSTSNAKKKTAPAALPTWDLEAIYPTIDAWQADFERLPKMAAQYKSYAGRLAEGAAVIRDAMVLGDEFSRLEEKVYCYARLKSDENTLDAANRSRVSMVESRMAELSDCFAWFDPELLAMDETKLRRFIASPTLAFYRRSLNETLRERAHTLSEPEERLLGTLSSVLGAPADTFEVLNDGDMEFGTVRNSAGECVKLTHGSYRMLLEDANTVVRRTAFRKIHRAYKKLEHTLASTLDATIQTHAVGAKIRHYSSSLQSALDGKKIPETVYTQLIDTVHAHLKPLHDYVALRKRFLKLDSLDMWDMYAPLVPNCRITYTWDEAVALVKAALAPMGKEYLKVLDLAFEQRWIDVPERKGKRSGGYSSGCYDTYPYILLNFHGTLDDVFTLAHEAGHSIHSYYSNHTQKPHYADYHIFVAEVASTTNEILLAEYMLKHTKDEALKTYLLAHLADEIRATVYRQTMFAEFELAMHRHAEKHEQLTAELLTKEYYALNTAYHGFKGDPLIGWEWARIPHFYYGFYVYQYATGMSAAIQLAKNILHGSKKNLDAYLGFLKAGSSKDVLDIMRDAGVDLEKPTPVAEALRYFDSLVKELATRDGASATKRPNARR